MSVLVDVISTCSLRVFIREVCETRTRYQLGLYVVSMRSLRTHTSSLVDVYLCSSTATRPYGADGYPRSLAVATEDLIKRDVMLFRS